MSRRSSDVCTPCRDYRSSIPVEALIDQRAENASAAFAPPNQVSQHPKKGKKDCPNRQRQQLFRSCNLQSPIHASHNRKT